MFGEVWDFVVWKRCKYDNCLRDIWDLFGINRTKIKLHQVWSDTEEQENKRGLSLFCRFNKQILDNLKFWEKDGGMEISVHAEECAAALKEEASKKRGRQRSAR